MTEITRREIVRQNKLTSWLEEDLIAHASDLARLGYLSRAEKLLSPLISCQDTSVKAIDLIAKIYAQQGRILEARNLWERALLIDPSNVDFQRAVKRCEIIQNYVH